MKTYWIAVGQPGDPNQTPFIYGAFKSKGQGVEAIASAGDRKVEDVGESEDAAGVDVTDKDDFLLGRVQMFTDSEAIPCLTPGAHYETRLEPRRVAVSVSLPSDLELTEGQASLLEMQMHRAIEAVLAPHFVETAR